MTNNKLIIYTTWDTWGIDRADKVRFIRTWGNKSPTWMLVVLYASMRVVKGFTIQTATYIEYHAWILNNAVITIGTRTSCINCEINNKHNNHLSKTIFSDWHYLSPIHISAHAYHNVPKHRANGCPTVGYRLALYLDITPVSVRICLWHRSQIRAYRLIGI